jgi:hypothetical protein
LRFGLVATAVLSWKGGTALWESETAIMNGTSIALMLSSYLTGFVLLVAAVMDGGRQSSPPFKRWLIPLALLLLFVSFFHLHRLREQEAGYPLTTDARIYMDYAGRLLQRGENPYTHSLVGSFRVHREPLQFLTSLLDGDLSGRVAYPALSVLIFIPFQLVGIPSELIYPLFLLLTLGVLYFWVCPSLRPIILLPFFADASYLYYSFGGVTDTIWALLLVLTIRYWTRPPWRAICFGLACAYKHQPWILAPYLLVRLWQENPGLPPREQIRQGLRFALLSGGTFLLINAPFILWAPKAWLLGISEPLRADMVTFGEGLSALTMLGIVIVPKGIFSVLLLAGFALSLYFYGRYFSRLRELIWILPGLLLWFSHRSLTSYWYFLIFPLLLALFRAPTTEEGLMVAEEEFALESEEQGTKPLARGTRRFGPGWVGWLVSLIVVVGLLLGWYASRAPALQVKVIYPLETVGTQVVRVTMRVKNQTAQIIEPRFTVQSQALQPSFWQVEGGPAELVPRQESVYTITRPPSFTGFDIRRGARILVADAHRYDLRAGTRVDGEPAFAFPDVIPNGAFHFWDRDNGQPTFWGLASEPARSGTIALQRARATGDPASSVVLRLPHGAKDQRAMVLLDTYLVLPEQPVEVTVRRPRGANRLPQLNLVYGFCVVIQGQRVWVLFGDAPGQGQLAANHHYWMIPAPEERWSTHRLQLREILTSLGVSTAPSVRRIPRFDHLDFPMAPTNFQLLLAVRQKEGPVEASFGPLRSTRFWPAEDAVFRENEAHPEYITTWGGEYNLDLRNYARAHHLFSEAVIANSAHGPAQFGLGEASFWMRHYPEAARAYQQSIALGYQPERAYKGLGWVHFNQGAYAAAAQAFQQAISLLQSVPEARGHLADAFKGLGLARLRLKQCTASAQAFDQARALGAAMTISEEELAGCQASPDAAPAPRRPSDASIE